MWEIIEKYIKDNREAIDLDEPSTRVWAGIESRLPGKKETTNTKVKSIWRYWRAAAAVAASIGVGYVGSFFQHQLSHNQAVDDLTHLEACLENGQQMKRAQTIHLQAHEMAMTASEALENTEHYDLAIEFVQVMDSLDKELQTIKADLKQDSCRADVIDKLKAQNQTKQEWMKRVTDQIE